MKDPYLMKGMPCEVWDNRDAYIELSYFYAYDNAGFPTFIEQYYKKMIDRTCPNIGYKYYRPIGTEWDFAPPWAVCSTIDQKGYFNFWRSEHVITNVWGTYESNFLVQNRKISCGICPDKTRYEGDAWKTSLRMRPEWAKVK